MSVVVLAEDDPDITLLISTMLADQGYDVLTAPTGQEALRLCREQRPALALLDVAMPGELDGFEVTRRLRADPATARTPVLLITARARPADIREGTEAGAEGYLVKPFDPFELLARIEELVARPQG